MKEDRDSKMAIIDEDEKDLIQDEFNCDNDDDVSGSGADDEEGRCCC